MQAECNWLPTTGPTFIDRTTTTTTGIVADRKKALCVGCCLILATHTLPSNNFSQALKIWGLNYWAVDWILQQEWRINIVKEPR